MKKTKILANHDSERALISSALLRPEAVEKILQLREDDFYFQDHRKYYNAIKAVEKEGQEISLITVNNMLLRTSEEDARTFTRDFVGEPSYHGLDAIYRDIKELSNKRTMLALLQDGAQEIGDFGIGLDSIISKIDTGIRGIYERSYRSGKRYGDLGTGIKRFAEMEVIPSGLGFLDNVIKGFRKSQLIILGARTSIGKSAFALNIAMKIAEHKKVILFSLEMDQEEIELRMCGIMSGINTDMIDTGSLDDYHLQRFNEAEEKLKQLDLIIYDDVYSLSDAVAIIKKEYYAGNLGLVVVDYLQQVTVDNKADRHLQVAEISRTLKQNAKQCRVPVLALSQMNRVSAGEEPQLHHLRESGAIEQDANMVIFLWQPDKEISPNMVECVIAKNRRSRTGKINAHFEKKYQRFTGA
jgi:replicative DNA helicase